MGRTLKALSAAVIAALLLSCAAVFTHSPGEARRVAGEFLNLAYKHRDYNGALALATQDFRDTYGIGYLKKTTEAFLKKYGKYEGLRAENYFYEQGSRDIVVFYTALSEGAVTYHQVTLTGTRNEGYRVSGLVVSDMDFRAGYRLVRKFKGE